MREFWGNLTNRIAKIPMAVVVVPFALGIFFAEMVDVPLPILFCACFGSLLGVITLTKRWQDIALFTMIFSVGVLLHSISYREEIVYGGPQEMVLKVEKSSVIRKGYYSAEAKIKRCQDCSLHNSKVILWSDSLVKFHAGDHLCLTSTIRPFRAEREQYARLMHHRGFIGSISINHHTIYEYIPAEKRTLHDWAVERLQDAMSHGDGRAVALAMTTGDRSEIGSELRQHYSASGASHLLAVSGLHIGIAFMLINLLLLPLVLLRYGNLLRSILAITLIWLYVWICGMSPSAVRAAIMFSLLQFSLSSLREYASINILAGTAFVMLAFDTHLLFDISFQLSFVAVAGIILWGMPLYCICSTRYRAINVIVGVLLVGVASTLATMPLVAHTFSTISLVGVLINPIVIMLANIIVLAGVVTLAIPLSGDIAQLAAKWQNCVVEWAASLPYGHFDVSMSEGAMWGIYALFVAVTLLFWLLPKRENKPKIEG